MPEADNADQIAYWNADGGENWAALQKYMDAQLEPYGLRAMDALAPAPGERLLDVGCGSGQTSLALGQAVDAGGTVVGLDVSQPLLDVARRRGPPSWAPRTFRSSRPTPRLTASRRPASTQCSRASA